MMDGISERIRSLGLDEKIGQLFLIGYPAGPGGFGLLERAVRDCAFGNVILFSRNAGTPAFLHAHLGAVRSLILGRTGIVPLVALDQEGGTVVRVTNGLTGIPGAMAVAAAYEGGRITLEDVRRLATVSGTELRALGFTWNLAPVADVNVNQSNPVIGVRSFGEDPGKTADLAAAYARGLSASGMLAAAKHFPGHGDTSVDSHLGLPLVSADGSRLESVEFVPFRRLISENVAAVMSAHVRFPAVEPDPVPGTLSRRVLTRLLRERFGFRGLIVTDCLEMKAIADNFPDAAVQAVLAGADMLSVSHTDGVQRAAFAAVKKAVLEGRIPESRIDESAARVLDAKSKLQPPEPDPVRALRILRAPESVELAERVSEASITVLFGDPDAGLSRGGLYIDVRPDNRTGAEDSAGGPDTVSGALGTYDGRYETVSLPADPDPTLADAAVSRIRGTPVALGTYAPGNHPGQAELVRKVAAACRAAGSPLAFVSMRNPYDARFLYEASGGYCRTIVCAWEYTPLSVRSVAKYLSGENRAVGGSPVRVAVRPD